MRELHILRIDRQCEELVDGRRPRNETSPVAQLSEQAALDDMERRLTTIYDDVSPNVIAAAVQNVRAHFDDSPIRDFVPLLVERRVVRFLQGPHTTQQSQTSAVA